MGQVEESWDALAARVREARIELANAERDHAMAVRALEASAEMLKEAEACFRAAKGELVERALGDAARLEPVGKKV